MLACGSAARASARRNAPARSAVQAYASLPPRSETPTTIKFATGEGTVVELLNGQLLRNDRPVRGIWEDAKRRWVSVGSIESGFPAFEPDSALLDPHCQGSTLRYTAQEKSRILFLNPASTVDRCKMRIRISYDEGASWPVSRRIYDTMTVEKECDARKGGYSSLTKTADLRIGALIEDRGDGHISIDFHKFGLQWILNGVSEP